MTTICADCKWCKHISKHHSIKRYVWDFYCLHIDSKVPDHRDIITGELIKEHYKHCNDINRGDCKLFKGK